MLAQPVAQEWLHQRLEGVEPNDFEEHVRFTSACPLAPPEPFRDIWIPFGEMLNLTREQCAPMRAIIIFCSPFETEQVENLSSFVQHIDGFGSEAPPMCWAPHTTNPATRPHRAQDVNTFRHTLQLGLDGIISGEPTGFHFALAVRGRLQKFESMANALMGMVNERRARAQYAEYLNGCIAHMIWEYLRNRLTPTIPSVDPMIPPGDPLTVHEYTFRELLGRGMFGSVYRLSHNEQGDACNQVAKVVRKQVVNDLQDLKSIQRMINVMTLLSSPVWQHPNICQLYQVYQTPTHLIFRMENGGPENLYRRLSYRQKGGPRARPLPCEKVKSIISQIVEAMRHLHVGPHIAHRDIKPENLIVYEPLLDDRVFIKLADFDLATVLEGHRMCRSPCGTVPFTAPEVLFRREYDGFAADVWSMGAVLLELLCGARIVESTLDSSDVPPEEANNPVGYARKIHRVFSQEHFASRFLGKHVRGELTELLQAMQVLMDGVMNVDPLARWDVSQAKASIVDAGHYVENSNV